MLAGTDGILSTDHVIRGRDEVTAGTAAGVEAFSRAVCVRVKRETQEKGGHSLSETQHQRHEHILHVFASIHVVIECSGLMGVLDKK